jgi:hypothetical protein
MVSAACDGAGLVEGWDDGLAEPGDELGDVPGELHATAKRTTATRDDERQVIGMAARRDAFVHCSERTTRI